MTLSLKKANNIIAYSFATQRGLIEFLSLQQEDIDVVSLAATVTKMNFPVSSGKPYILFIGTMEPRKNLQRLLLAYKELGIELHEKYDFVIIGGRGWGRSDLSTYCHELEISNHVRIQGYLEHDDMNKWLANARMLAMPSLYEGFGLPILDAMTLGVPVMTSTNSSMQEVAGGGAMLVDPLHIGSMKDAMERLLTDDRLRDTLIKAGKAQAAHFSWKKTAVRTGEIFSEALNRLEAQ